MQEPSKIKRVNLTDRFIKTLKAPSDATARTEVWDLDVRQLRLRVTHTGVRSFSLLARVKGQSQQKRYTLGRYLDEPLPGAALFDPMAETPFLTLAQARQKARVFLTMLQTGVEPNAAREATVAAVADRAAQERQREAAAAHSRQQRTFARVRERFLAAKAPVEGMQSDTEDPDAKPGKRRRGGKRLRDSTHGEYARLLALEEFGDWADHVIDDISRRDVRDVIEEIEDNVSFITAGKVFAVLRALFNWAVRQDILPTSPMADMDPPELAEARSRVLSDDELRLVYECMGELGVFAAPYRLLALTGQRLKEWTALRISEVCDIDGDPPYIDLPGTRTKNKLPHVVPLAPLAAEVLREGLAARIAQPGCPFAFTTTGKTPVSGFSKTKAKLDRLVAERVGQLKAEAEARGDGAALARLAKVDLRWRMHDLRRTMVTGLNSMGVLPHVVEAVVNHVSGAAKAGVAGTYNKALYLPERRRALELWARHVERLVRA